MAGGIDYWLDHEAHALKKRCSNPAATVVHVHNLPYQYIICILIFVLRNIVVCNYDYTSGVAERSKALVRNASNLNAGSNPVPTYIIPNIIPNIITNSMRSILCTSMRTAVEHVCPYFASSLERCGQLRINVHRIHNIMPH